MLTRVVSAAVVLLCLLMSPDVADARPKHHSISDHRVQYHAHSRNYWSHTRHRRHAVRPASRAAVPTASSSTVGFGAGSDLVVFARSQIGNGAVYGRRTLWCARFMNYALNRIGLQGTGSDTARSFARYGTRIPGPQIGAIAVMSRRGGGHVGVVSGIDSRGNPIVVSGNHRKRVAESVYPASRVYAYVVPR